MNKKNKDNITFMVMIIIMIMIGVGFDSDLNSIQNIEKLSPQKAPNFKELATTFLIIIALVSITKKELLLSTEKNISKKSRKIRKFLIKQAITLEHSIDKIPKIDVKHIIHLKPHKRIKQYYYKDVNPSIYSEVERTRKLFIKAFQSEFKSEFVAVLLIIATVGMAVFGVMFAPGADIIKKEVIMSPVAGLEKQYFSPEQVLNPAPLIIAVIIIITVSYASLKKQKNKKSI